MTVSTLDNKTALVIVDLQKGIRNFPVVHSFESIIENSASLAKAFRAEHLPVVLVNAAGFAPGRSERPARLTELPPDFAELVPELNQTAQDHTVTKRTWGAFTGTDLEQYLRGKGVTQVVVTGVATSIGVESTARQAHELGFNVTLVSDAMTDMSLDAHENSITRIFPRLGETGTTQDILNLLVRRGES